MHLLSEKEACIYNKIIDSYRPSSGIVQEFGHSRFAVIAGPTGAGKDTLRDALVSSPNFIKILSTTSRPPRPGEQDGVEYHFRDLEFFNQGLAEKRFLQAALVHNQQISCLDIVDIRHLNENQLGLSILIVQTEIQLRKLNKNLKTVFVVPPSLDVLNQRMRSGRGESNEEITRRLNAAKIELKIALKQPSYYCVINDNVERMHGIAEEFLIKGLRNESEDAAGRATIKSILSEQTGENADE